MSSSNLHEQPGLDSNEQLARRIVYGLNEITVPYKNIKSLLFMETLNPFYVFQIFSVILWFFYDYYYYACVILIMSIFGIVMSILQTKRNQDSLRETAKNTGLVLMINEKGEVKEIETKNLVLGDIIEIPSHGCTMQCDAVLLSGNCIIDESMMTGESVPVTKTPLPFKRDLMFDKKEHSRHTLFCGTKVIQTRYIGSEKVLALVINIGNITAKGGLIRSILYPPPVDYKFEQDSYKFIKVLGLIAFIGFLYTLISKVMRGVNLSKIAIESLDIITVVVPPALPAAMSVGRYYAQKRLEESNIYCISPRSINVAGGINCCCFDKTGTLTEDGLDMWGVIPKSATNSFQIPIREVQRLPRDHFLFGMVTCHSITVMGGKLMGDPLDIKMLESTGWILEDQSDIPDNRKFGIIHPTVVRPPEKDTYQMEYDIKADEQGSLERQSSVNNLLSDIGLLSGEASDKHGIVREFPFLSSLQRMSVITKRLCENHYNVYCKGSPEMIHQLCLSETIPSNYFYQLSIFAKQGYRVIAMSYKRLDPKISYTKLQRLSRENVEMRLEFLGFVILENRLKPDSSKVIGSLNEAKIRSIMVTGDNILTAMSVARDCGIVSQSQTVIIVNVRRNKKQKHELYYTLEMGNDKNMQQQQNNDLVLEKDDKSNLQLRLYLTLADLLGACEDIHNRIGYSPSVSTDLQNSNSLCSVDTAETWTEEVDPFPYSNYLSNLQNTAIEQKSTRSYRFAMSGETWEIVRQHFFEELLPLLLTRTAVFARMSPDHKQSLILELQKMDYCVAMCGDGANDCGALKAAHAGISLSETESSIASPFTSRSATIAAVPKVIKEGRAALVTSFGIFKYMAAYSLVQFVSVIILYSIDSNLTDKQYLFIDLGLISVFAFFFGKTEAFDKKLCDQVPLSSLISLSPLTSLILHLLTAIGFQITAWIHVQTQPWFVSFKISDEHLGCFQNYTIFGISCFQYIALAFVFSKGKPYRKPIWSNFPFCLALVINFFIVIYLVTHPSEWIAELFQFVLPPQEFRYWILTYGVINFLVHLIIEKYLIEILMFKKFEVSRMDINKRYVKAENDLRQCPNWPPISPSEVSSNEDILENSESTPTYVELGASQKLHLHAGHKTTLFGFFDNQTLTDNRQADNKDLKLFKCNKFEEIA